MIGLLGAVDGFVEYKESSHTLETGFVRMDSTEDEH